MESESGLVNKTTKKREKSVYNIYMSDSLKDIKEKNPGISHKDAFSMATSNWEQYKIDNNIVVKSKPKPKPKPKSESENVDSESVSENNGSNKRKSASEKVKYKTNKDGSTEIIEIKKEIKKKDPDAPKRKPNPYNIYMSVNIKEYKSKLPEGQKQNSEECRKIFKMVAESWKTSPDNPKNKDLVVQ